MAQIVKNDNPYIMTSHSIDGTFNVCPRRFEFLHVYMRAPERESDAYAADVGTALHEGTQEWQRSLYNGVSPLAARQAGELALLRWWPWETEERIEKSDGRTVGRRTLGNALLLLDEIFNAPFWSDWELVAVEGFGPAIEIPWRIIHTSLGQVTDPYGVKRFLATQGKIDFIMRNRWTGQYRIIDLKSTEKRLPAHDSMFRHSGQAGQYGLVLNHALGLDWETDGLDITYLVLYFDEDAQRVYPLNYHLEPAEIQDHVDTKVERLLRMHDYASRHHWPRATHGCEFYGTPCGFLDVCHRRDESFLTEWFDFEIASGRFHKYERVYEPVWTLEA